MWCNQRQSIPGCPNAMDIQLRKICSHVSLTRVDSERRWGFWLSSCDFQSPSLVFPRYVGFETQRDIMYGASALPPAREDAYTGMPADWNLGLYKRNSHLRFGLSRVDKAIALQPHVNLRASLAVETAAIQPKPACAGYKAPDFTLVRVGGLRFYSREFHSPRLKLTPMPPAKAARAIRGAFPARS
jgi:hypothetical protein